MSVPNQNSLDGGLRRLMGASACGSTVPSHGAKTATPIMHRRMPPPMSAVGWRRNASRQRRQVGNVDLSGAAARASRVATSISIANARIEEHVREIDQEVDHDVDGGKNQGDPLNDGVVSTQDR